MGTRALTATRGLLSYKKREALFPGLDLDSGLDWTLDWTHGLWLNSALEHSLKPDQLVDALAIALDLCKSWIFSINAGI